MFLWSLQIKAIANIYCREHNYLLYTCSWEQYKEEISQKDVAMKLSYGKIVKNMSPWMVYSSKIAKIYRHENEFVYSMQRISSSYLGNKSAVYKTFIAPVWQSGSITLSYIFRCRYENKNNVLFIGQAAHINRHSLAFTPMADKAMSPTKPMVSNGVQRSQSYRVASETERLASLPQRPRSVTPQPVPSDGDAKYDDW